jgi:hypothetical protein
MSTHVLKSDRSRPIQSSNVPQYVRALAMGISAYLIGIHVWSWVLMAPFYLGGHSDFRQIYAAAHMVRSGRTGQLYDPVVQESVQNKLVGLDQVIPFIRPAYELLVFVPLSLLPYRVAYFIFLGCNLAFLAVIYRLLRPRMEKLAQIFSWLPAALLIGFLPIGAALIEGQDSILLLLLFVISLVLFERGREFAAGIIIGIAVFKFQLALPFAVLLLIWRRWQFVKGFALTATGAAAASIWITGIEQVRAYVRLLLFMAQPVPIQDVYPLTIARMTNLHGMVYGIGGSLFSGRWIAFFTGVASVALLMWLRSHSPKRQDMFTTAALGATLLSYYLFFHDVSLVIIPIAALLNKHVEAEGSREKGRMTIARLSTLLFVGPVLLPYRAEYLYLVGFVILALLFATASRSTESEALTS